MSIKRFLEPVNSIGDLQVQVREQESLFGMEILEIGIFQTEDVFPEKNNFVNITSHLANKLPELRIQLVPPDVAADDQSFSNFFNKLDATNTIVDSAMVLVSGIEQQILLFRNGVTPVPPTESAPTAPVGQTGTGATPPVTQTGAGPTLPVTQTGTGATPPVTPTGAGPTLPVTQTGTGATPPVTPTGAGPTLPVTQTGTGATPPVTPTGAGPTSPVTQTGTGATPPVTQTGAGPTLPVTQTGTVSTSPVSQTASALTPILPDYAMDILSAAKGMPWAKCVRLPRMDAYGGMMPGRCRLFQNLRGPDGNAMSVVYYECKLDIDNDGSGGNAAHDRFHQSDTNLHDMNGALDANKIAFAVLPLDRSETRVKRPGLPDFGRELGLHLGDVGIAFWRQRSVGEVRTTSFIYGDKGPANKIGEGSVHMANALGINSNPVSGGIDPSTIKQLKKGIIHIAFPGSGKAFMQGRRSTLIPNQIDARAKQFFISLLQQSDV